VEARPYLRTRFALAEVLEALGRRDEALDHYRDRLRLNPDDNQGVRDLALPLLLVAGRDDEPVALLDRSRGDPSALWSSGGALWT
jgi:tetratricopeptide (TPR) repeat protein